MNGRTLWGMESDAAKDALPFRRAFQPLLGKADFASEIHHALTYLLPTDGGRQQMTIIDMHRDNGAYLLVYRKLIKE
ncbi:hypothetical protein GCM10027346_37700 [Hymenobacter seoulensis]